MNTTVSRGAVVLLLALVAACGSSGPTSPTGTNPPSAFPLPGPPPATIFPPLSGPSRTFVFDRAQSKTAMDYTRNSRFILYDNGAFVLQFPSVGPGGYRGGYKDANGVITFEWEGWNVAGPWGATGTLKGDSLAVQYNEVMQFSDFESASYVLMP